MHLIRNPSQSKLLFGNLHYLGVILVNSGQKWENFEKKNMDGPLSGEKNFVTMNNRPTIKQTDKTEHRAKTAHQSHHGSSISFVKSWKIICLAHRIQQPIPKLE